VVDLSEGGGAVLYGRIVDGDRLALSGGRHEAGRGGIGLLEGEGDGIATMLSG
jgi:hypothetical protein